MTVSITNLYTINDFIDPVNSTVLISKSEETITVAEDDGKYDDDKR